jgi:DNA mismatch endonuclease (patch repair protein)
MPKARRGFWIDKFARNSERDQRKILNLRDLGYAVLVLWECETAELSRLVAKIDAFLNHE